MQFSDLSPEEKIQCKKTLAALRLGLEGYILEHPNEIAPKLLYELSESPYAFMNFQTRQMNRENFLHGDVIPYLQQAAGRDFIKEFREPGRLLTRRELFAEIGSEIAYTGLLGVGLGTVAVALLYNIKPVIDLYKNPKKFNDDLPDNMIEHLKDEAIIASLGVGTTTASFPFWAINAIARTDNKKQMPSRIVQHEGRMKENHDKVQKYETFLGDVESALQEKLKQLGITPITYKETSFSLS